MSTMKALPEDNPMYIAFKELEKTDEYKTALNWASHVEHANGSMWFAFYKGYEKGQESLQSDLNTAQERIKELEADLTLQKEERDIIANQLMETADERDAKNTDLCTAWFDIDRLKSSLAEAREIIDKVHPLVCLVNGRIHIQAVTNKCISPDCKLNNWLVKHGKKN